MAIRFDHSVPKVRADGVTALSDSLAQGEKLVSGETYDELIEQGYFDSDDNEGEAPKKKSTRSKKK